MSAGRYASQRPVFSTNSHRKMALHGRDHVAEHVGPERVAGQVAVGHDDDHRDRLLVRVKVVENGVHPAVLYPTGFVRKAAVQQIEDGVSLFLGGPRWGVDAHLPHASCGLRVVLDRLYFTSLDSLTTHVERLRWRGK